MGRLCAGIAVFLMICACQTQRKDSVMEQSALTSQLNALVDSGESVMSLADSLLQDARQNPATLLQVWEQAYGMQSGNCAFQTAESLGILSVSAFLSHLEQDTGLTAKALMFAAVAGIDQKINDSFTSVIIPLLDDLRPLPAVSKMPSDEEPPLERRVCDEAFILLRRLLLPDEVPLEQRLKEKKFLSLDDVDKDRLIALAHDKKQWVQLFSCND